MSGISGGCPGVTNGQIARRLGVSEGTVRIHLQNIYGRLQVSSRTAAVTHAFPNRQLLDDGTNDAFERALSVPDTTCWPLDLAT